jgi:hypothetical protein
MFPNSASEQTKSKPFTHTLEKGFSTAKEWLSTAENFWLLLNSHATANLSRLVVSYLIARKSVITLSTCG